MNRMFTILTLLFLSLSVRSPDSVAGTDSGRAPGGYPDQTEASGKMSVKEPDVPGTAPRKLPYTGVGAYTFDHAAITELMASHLNKFQGNQVVVDGGSVEVSRNWLTEAFFGVVLLRGIIGPKTKEFKVKFEGMDNGEQFQAVCRLTANLEHPCTIKAHNCQQSDQAELVMNYDYSTETGCEDLNLRLKSLDEGASYPWELTPWGTRTEDINDEERKKARTPWRGSEAPWGVPDRDGTQGSSR